MVIVQPRCRYGGDEKLAAIGVRSGIRHTDKQWSAVFHLKGFVVKILAVYTYGTSTVAIFDITTWKIYFIVTIYTQNLIKKKKKKLTNGSVTLYHKLLYHTMKSGPRVVFSSYAGSGKSDEVFHSFRRDIAEQSNDYSSSRMIANHDVQVHVIGDCKCFCL